MIKELIFGTTNPAKVLQIRGALAPAGIEVNGVVDKSVLPEVVEDGKTANENARKKALVYAKALGKTVFSMDAAIYIDGVLSELQPGLNVRRIPNFVGRPNDEEMIDYYSRLIESVGGVAEGRSEYGICIATPDGRYKETLIVIPRRFISKPTTSRQNGFPLSSLTVDPILDKYTSDMSQEEHDSYWHKLVGNKLVEFVQSVDF